MQYFLCRNNFTEIEKEKSKTNSTITDTYCT